MSRRRFWFYIFCGVLISICAVGSNRLQDGTPCTQELQSELTKYKYQIVFESTFTSSSIYVINADGSNQLEYKNKIDLDHNYNQSLSPDGQHVAFLKSHNSLPTNPKLLVTDFSWSHEGNQIAFGTPSTEIYISDADGANLKRIYYLNSFISEMGSDSTNYPNWSPDGRYIVFSLHEFLGRVNLDDSQDTWTDNLFVAKTDGSAACPITFGETYYNDKPVWISPTIPDKSN